MSKFLKVFCCICIVGVLCAPTFGVGPVRMFWVGPGGEGLPALDGPGTTTIYAGQGDTVCVEIWMEGIGADFNSAAAQGTQDDGAACRDGGSIDADCSTVAVNAGNDNCIGAGTGNSGYYSLNTTATNHCGALGDGDRWGWLRGYADPNHYAIIDDDGCYTSEVCYVVSADCCGPAAIYYQGTPDFNTIIADQFQNAVMDAIFSNLVITVGPQNDDCGNATPVVNETVTYDSTCATTDGTECTTLDMWYLYTADCTGVMRVTSTDGTVGIYAGSTCVPSGNLACGSGVGPVGQTTEPVNSGEQYLVQLGEATSGGITFNCEPYCTDGLPAGHPTTVAECGPPDQPNDDPCLLWFCDPAQGGCTAVSNVDGTACDDGDPCTDNDACEAGACTASDPHVCDDGAVCTVDTCDSGVAPPEDPCVYTDINSISCGDIGDCPAASESCTGGFCVCVENPVLCLNVAQGPAPASGGPPCFEEDKLIYVTVDMGFATVPICAAQFYLEYDTAMLSFVDIAPGGGVFNTVIFESVDEAAGTIDYLVGENPAAICLGTSGPATIATVTFLAVGDCKTEGVCFRGHNPPTRLGGVDGSEVCPKGHVRPDGSCGLLDNPDADPCCTGVFSIDSTAPVVTCPDLVQFGNADCGVVTRYVTWGPVTATDNCDGDIPVTCIATHNSGWDISHLAAGGGDFPPGVAIIDCNTPTDLCGNGTDCSFTVVNSGQNNLHVDVELSPTMDAGPLRRGIEFEVSDCGDIANPEVVSVCADGDFGFPKNIPGHAKIQAKIPPGNWMCIEAWDPLHTLKATCDVTCEVIEGKGETWFASFKGSKDLSDTCHWLVNGNLNGLDGDGVGRIDILDYVTYLAAVATNPIPGGNTPCGTLGPHGDINGDGIVNLQDFSFILVNIFNMDKAGCDAVCFPSPDVAVVAPGRESISVGELRELGFDPDVIDAADLDHNNRVDLADMALHLGAGQATRSVRGSR